MKKILLIPFLLLLTGPLLAQEEALEEILQSKDTYESIVRKAEQYFKDKKAGPGLNAVDDNELDDDYVKFKRWQSFWKNSLTADGRLGDISAYWRNKQLSPTQQGAMISPYANVAWNNISYGNYITGQIGLGRITSVGFHPTDPNTFYVGAAIGGVWRTTNGGTSYTPLGDDLPFMAVSSIIVRKDLPGILYIAVSDHVWYGPPSIGVYRSINGGGSWQPTALSFNLADNIRIYWMEADPNNPDKMFVATSNGLYRTLDGFLSISRVSTVNCFDVKINKGNASLVYMGGNNGEFYRSVDGGSSFNLIRDFGNGSVYTALSSLNTAKVYARNANQLYKSTDNGASFPVTGVTMPISDGVLAFAQSNQDILLTGNFETNRSDNDGASFYATSQWLGNNGLPLIHVDQRNIFTNPLQPDYVYYCNDGGLYRYIVSSNQFVNLCNGLLITQYYDISVAQSNNVVMGGGSQDNGSMYREANGNWDDYASTGDGMNGDIDPTDANTRYWAYQNGSLRRWVNGTNSTISPPGKDASGAWETPYQLDPTNPSRLIAGYNLVYESLNKGNSWTDISGGANFGGNLEEIAVAKANPNRIYATRGNQLFVKATGSNTWTTRNMPGTASDIEVDPVNIDLIYISVAGFIGGSKVFRSADAGVTWTNFSGSLPNVSAQALEGYDAIPGALFVGTDAGVYYRDNSFDDWQLYGKLPHTRVTDIEIQYAAKLIRIGTHGRGVFEAPLIVSSCNYGDPDADNDGVCDANDECPNFNNSLNGTPCDDGDPNSTGEKYDGCECKGGVPTQAYCAAAGSAGTGSDWIKRVNLNSLDNGSGQTFYSDFRSKSTKLSAGGTYTLKVELNAVFPLDKVYAWIDYNRNGVFDNAELINLSSPGNNTLFEGMVTVPANVGNLATTMRVRCIYADPNSPQPCGNYFGEVEDYTINFGYCQAAGGFNTGSDWISNVSLNTINNNSVQTYYSDFTQQRTDLARGESYPLSIKLNYAFAPNHVYAWIDYNHNKVFEAGEMISLSKPATGPNSTGTGTVTVPANALPGETIMRVRSQYDGTVDPQPCGSPYAGEVEDYTVNITYCAAAGADYTSIDYINRVTLNTIDNSSGKSGYSNFKNLSTTLVRGASYPIEVQANYAFDPEPGFPQFDSIYVWIDYDKDGIFEPNEQTIMSNLVQGGNSKATGIVNVPNTAIQGETVMRVRLLYAASESNIAEPCGNSYPGEVEDYSIILSYCGAKGADGTGSDWINKVTINQIDNSSSQTAYSDFSNLSTILYKNNSYQLKLSLNYAFPPDTAYAWIDFDHNNSFTANERISMSNFTANSSNSVSTGIVYVPDNAPTGETTIRVRVIYANPNPPDPCNAYFGEVEDYSAVVTDNQGIGPCIPTITLGNELVSLATGYYKASENILSTSTILTARVVKLVAGKSVLLQPGFKADNGSVVTIEIKSCTE